MMESTPERVKQRYRSLVQHAQEADFGDLDDVVVIDTETTGVSFKQDQLTQIAAARMHQGEIVEWYVTFVNPGKPIPEDIQRLTNIHDEDVADAPAPAEALAGLVAFVGSSNLVAHNAHFDKTFCTKDEAGAALADNIWIDSLDLSRIALPRLRSHRLLDLVHTFGAPVPTHRADDDVLALCAVYRILLAAVDAMPPELVGCIAGLSSEEVWPTAHVFKQIEHLQVKAGRRAMQTGLDGSAKPLGAFDLRKMREERVAKIEHRPRVDADDIAADPQRELVFADDEHINQAFTEQGIVARLYESFEPREEQKHMSVAVNRAFASSSNLVVEAGTGVGKSLAYLLPAALAAQKNNITVGIATKTNALLDQLMNHELPALAAELGNLEYVSLKGFSHYLCLRSLDHLVQSGVGTRSLGDEEIPQAPAVAALLSFAEQADYDDIDSLKADYRAVPRSMVTTTSADCLRRKCRFFGSRCFGHGARQRAEAADIVVTNQALLFCDVAAEGGLLPHISYWVVDEAHGAEDEARQALSCAISSDALSRLAERVSAESASRNIFLRAERAMTGRVQTSEEHVRALLGSGQDQLAVSTGNSLGDTLLFGLSAKARAAGGRFTVSATEFASHIHDLVVFDDTSKKSGYDQVDLWLNDDIRSSVAFQNLVSLGRVMCDDAEKLISACQELMAFMDEESDAAHAQREIASTVLELKELLVHCETILFDGLPTYAYAAHLVKKKGGSRAQQDERLEALMLSVADELNETLFATTHSIVFTSATLTVGDSFDNFVQALGLGQSEFSNYETLQLHSSYDFDTNMVVYVVEDMPEPSAPAYLTALNELLIGVHRAQQGSTLTLFTNRRDMEKSHAVVQEALREDDLQVVCQRWGVSTKWLRDEFLSNEHLSLFALKSFWEGFDAPGATLKTVVIPKLPFAKPTDPLSCERASRDSSAWSHYVLPAAVLETKQAAGRLIRSSTDSGALVLADKRLVTKGYGKVFLRSLPSQNIKVLPMKQIVEELARGRASS